MMKAALDFGQNQTMWNPAGTQNGSAAKTATRPGRYILWIDGAGAYLLCLGEKVSIGGPSLDNQSADVPLLASLSRHRATIIRSREGYVLEPHSSARVGNRVADSIVYLNNGYQIELGASVRLRFWLPTVLSATAVLEFLSDHRPSRSVDGVVLMDETCLIGPGRENHVRCPQWPESVVLYVKQGAFCCKSRSDLFVGASPLRDGERIQPGDVVSGGDGLRFRIEAAQL